MPKNIRTTDFYKDMTLYHACECAEGFCGGEDASEDEQTAAWQFIYDTKAYLTLQGWYGRTLRDLINAGIVTATPKGN